MRIVTALLVLFLAAPVYADIYRCQGDDGHVTYSNAKARGCRKLDVGPVNTMPSPRARTPTPKDFPKVSPTQQKSRDDERRAILEQELAREEKAHAEADRQFTQQKETVLPTERNAGGGINGAKVEARLEPYRAAAELHRQNVEALKRELARLR